MEIWGINNFDNTAAQEWLADFGENDFRLIDRTLAGVANLLDVDELDADEAAEALVAAECIAAALGHPASKTPVELDDWLVENGSAIVVKPLYVQMAQQATSRVLADSGLRDIWAQTEHLAAWETAVQDLQTRLEK